MKMSLMSRWMADKVGLKSVITCSIKICVKMKTDRLVPVSVWGKTRTFCVTKQKYIAAHKL